ncbi:MAG TPA: hypothetical protein VIY86_10010, partial [Pirellulaceae bacterium]
MGSARLLLNRRQPLRPDVIEHVALTDGDGQPCHVDVVREEGSFLVSWPSPSSGYIRVPWLFEDETEVLLSTATVASREEPYLLVLELARGLLGRVLGWSEDWSRAGLSLSPEIRTALDSAVRNFSLAATRQHDPAVAEHQARASLESAFLAERFLARDYCTIIFSAWSGGSGPRCPQLGISRAAAESNVPPSFSEDSIPDLIAIPTVWGALTNSSGDLEFTATDLAVDQARASGCPVMIGPLLRSKPEDYPPHFGNDAHSFSSMMAAAIGFARTMAERYRGRVAYWNVASGGNVPFRAVTDPLNQRAWGPEERLHLTAALVDAVHRADPQATVLVTVEQPWGDYLARDPDELPPVTFADSLARAGLGLSALGLCLDFDLREHALGPRDPLAWLQMIDRFAILGLPMILFLRERSLSPPSVGVTAKPIAHQDSGGTSDSASTLGHPTGAHRLMTELVALLACQRAVSAVIWDASSDTTHKVPGPSNVSEFPAEDPW